MNTTHTADSITRADILAFRDSGSAWLGKVQLVKAALRGDRNARERIAYVLNANAAQAVV